MKRVTYFAEAELEGIDVSRRQVRLADLSTGGAFVDTRTVLPPGTIARLRFSVLGRAISVQAEITRATTRSCSSTSSRRRSSAGSSTRPSYLTVRMPFMPIAKWPGNVQMNW